MHKQNVNKKNQKLNLRGLGAHIKCKRIGSVIVGTKKKPQTEKKKRESSDTKVSDAKAYY